MVCIIGAGCAVTLVIAPKFSSVNVLGEFRHVISSLDCRLMVRAKEAVEPVRCGCTLAARLLRHISCHRFVRFHLCCDSTLPAKTASFLGTGSDCVICGAPTVRRIPSETAARNHRTGKRRLFRAAVFLFLPSFCAVLSLFVIPS